jgi:hypothetical protein
MHNRMEEAMPLNNKQKRCVWIGVAALAVLYIAPRVYQQQRFSQQQKLAKPSPAIPLKPAAVPPAPPAAPAAQPTIPFVIAMGKYSGGSLESTRQCKVDLEMRPQGDAYLGYVTMVCFNPFPNIPNGRMPRGGTNVFAQTMHQMTPASAIMTGTVKNGDLVFTVAKSIGILSDGCPLTGTFTVSTFGLGKVAAQWQAGTCQGGQLILQHL